jgi:hypothetical protein
MISVLILAEKGRAGSAQLLGVKTRKVSVSASGLAALKGLDAPTWHGEV